MALQPMNKALFRELSVGVDGQATLTSLLHVGRHQWRGGRSAGHGGHSRRRLRAHTPRGNAWSIHGAHSVNTGVIIRCGIGQHISVVQQRWVGVILKVPLFLRDRR